MTQKTLHTGVAVAVTLVVVTVFFIIGVSFDSATLSQQAMPAAAGSSQVVAQDVQQGSGRAAQQGDTVVVNYTGKLQNGTVFDTSVGRPPMPGCPAGYCFVLGQGQVIAGWEQGLVGAQKGTRRVLIVPPALGYGSVNYGPIPANSTLIFEIEVVDVIPATQ